MSAAETIRSYYGAVRGGDPLHPYFMQHPDVVKFGITERLTGYEEIADGLERQNRETAEWVLESRALRVVERATHAWFSDDVYMEWFDTTENRSHAYDARWSGTLERDGPEWRFVGMHVSAPQR